MTKNAGPGTAHPQANPESRQGWVEPGFEAVDAAFERVAAAHIGGIQLCVYEHGREVVNLWSGVSGPTSSAFTSDSLVLTASCTKGMTALCALMLVDRGLLDLDAPVTAYWPEFAQNDKAGIPVRWLLTHRSGLALFDPIEHVELADLLDWDRAVSALAAQRPLWQPGAYCGYHAVTFGFLVGEVIRRVSGRTVGRFLAENVTGPLGADFWIGLPEQHEHRVVPTVPPPDSGFLDLVEVYRANGVDTSSPLARAMLDSARYDRGPAIRPGTPRPSTPPRFRRPTEWATPGPSRASTRPASAMSTVCDCSRSRCWSPH